MRNILSLAAVGGVALMLGACGQTELQKAEALPQQPATGTPFTQSLTGYYRQAAESQWTGSKDFGGSEHLARKAQAVAAGQVVAPDTIQEQGPGVKKNGELTEARERFMAAMGREAATKAPDDAARAQVAYDCWLEEASDPTLAKEGAWLEKKVRNCRADFYTAMDRVDAATKLVGQYVRHDRYVVYFDNGSAKLTPQGTTTLRNAVEAARENHNHILHVSVSGGADRTGSEQANQALSERRAAAVREFLAQNGVAPNLIFAEGRGEHDPQIATADGVAEPQNRSVAIIFETQ